MKNDFFCTIKEKPILFLLYIVLTIFVTFTNLYYPLFLNNIMQKINNITLQQIFIFILFSIFVPLLSALKDKTLNFICNMFSLNISRNLYKKIFLKDLLELKKKQTNELVRTINNYSFFVCSYYMYNVVELIISVFSSLIIIYILSKHNLLISFMILFLNFIRVLCIYKLENKVKKENHENIKTEHFFYSLIDSYIKKIKIIISRKKGKETMSQVCFAQSQFLQVNKKYSEKIAYMYVINDSSSWVILYIVLFIGVILTHQSIIDILFLPVIYSYCKEINSCFNCIGNFQTNKVMVDVYDKLVKEIMNIKVIKSDGIKDSIKKLSLSHVTFSYDADGKIFENINHSFEPGFVNVVIGKNGTGKSTLIKVMAGLYTNYEGEILLNDQSLSNYNLQYLYNNEISILTQDALLFPGTIEENIQCMKTGSITDICEYLNIHDISKKVNIDGSNLSEGERRVILFARTYFDTLNKDSSLIIFDEPTYAVEESIARKINYLIQELANKKIVILISHNDVSFNKYTSLILNI